jgi:hypothetical protein
MKTNVGGLDRVGRLVVGAGLVVWAVTGGPVWAWIGVVPILTGALGWCPLYIPFGISSCRKR